MLVRDIVASAPVSRSPRPSTSAGGRTLDEIDREREEQYERGTERDRVLGRAEGAEASHVDPESALSGWSWRKGITAER